MIGILELPYGKRGGILSAGKKGVGRRQNSIARQKYANSLASFGVNVKNYKASFTVLTAKTNLYSSNSLTF